MYRAVVQTMARHAAQAGPGAELGNLLIVILIEDFLENVLDILLIRLGIGVFAKEIQRKS